MYFADRFGGNTIGDGKWNEIGESNGSGQRLGGGSLRGGDGVYAIGSAVTKGENGKGGKMRNAKSQKKGLAGKSKHFLHQLFQQETLSRWNRAR
jgi:hypothetical protein